MKIFHILVIIFCMSQCFGDQTFTDKKGIYTLTFPDTWELKEEDTGKIERVTARSSREYEGDEIAENLILTYDYSRSSQHLKEVSKENLKEIQDVLDSFKIVKQKKVSIAGEKALFVISKGISNVQNFEGREVQFMLYSLIIKGHPLTILCTSLESSYPRFRPIFEKIIASMKFSNTAS